MSTLADRLAEPDMEGLSDTDAAAALNAPDPENGTVPVNVPTHEARGLLLTTGEWPAIVMAAEDASVPTQVRGLCILVRDTLTLTQELETTNPVRYGAILTVLNGLVQAELISVDTRDALLALAERPRSWAEANGWPQGVTARDVGLARGGV
jgi:hypothetical protein